MDWPPMLVVVPTLNEVAHVERLCRWIAETTPGDETLIVVADGGSADGTQEVVRNLAKEVPNLELIDNEARVQAAGINRAVALRGRGRRYLVRIDAHGRYPEDFITQLLGEAEATGADAVVVAMRTVGHGFTQRAVAAAQNSLLANGGSAHRRSTMGCWTEHGHHALMRMNMFVEVGGYDERFSHNEDAELDARILASGGRIWLTGRTSMDYFPRSTLRALYRQYLKYGAGRAMNIRKHGSRPRLRQLVPLGSLLAVSLVVLAPWTMWALFPVTLYLAVCAAFSLLGWLRKHDRADLVSFLPAMVMHLGWALGFCSKILARPLPDRRFVE